MAHPREFTAFVESDACHEIGKSFGRCLLKMLINDRDIGVVNLGHVEREIESTRSYDLAQRLKTG